MLRNFLAVMIGGAVGAALRYGIGLLIGGWRPFSLPIATLIVNVAGCLILGLAFGLIAKNTTLSQPMTLMLTAGFCGALTTFSTFTAETVTLMDNGKFWAGIGYVALSVCLGYIAFVIGRFLIK